MENLGLAARGLLGSDSNNHTCPAEDTSGPDIVPLVGSMTFHTLAIVLAGAFSAATLTLSFFHVSQHANHYTCPIQQRQIIRIIFLIPYVAVISFLCVCFDSVGAYIHPALDFGCSFALSAFLLLLCDFVLSNPGGFDDLFGQGAWAKGQFTTSSPGWLKWLWYFVLQFIPLSMVIWLVTIITLAVGTYCETSNKPWFAHIWVQVLKAIGTILAVLGILRFYKLMKAGLVRHKVMLKLMAFKGIILVNLIQNVTISLLVSSHKLKPTKYLSYEDATVVLPSLLLACEMILFALLGLYAFPVAPYKQSQQALCCGPKSAISNAINLADLLSAFIRGPMRLVRGQRRNNTKENSETLTSPSTYENLDMVSQIQHTGAGAPVEPVKTSFGDAHAA